MSWFHGLLVVVEWWVCDWGWAKLLSWKELLPWLHTPWCRGWAAVWVGLGHIRTWMCLCWELAQSMDAFKLRYIYYNEGENGWLLHLFVFCKTTYQIRNNKHSYETVEDKVGLYRKMRKGKIVWWEQKQFIHSGFMLLRLVIAVLWHVSDWQQMSSSTKIISISWKSNIPFK